MSMRSEAKRSVFVANKNAGGAIATLVQRKSHCEAFIKYCFAHNMPLESMKEVTFAQVKRYLTDRGLPGDAAQSYEDFAAGFTKAHGKKPLTTATLHNVLSSIRVAIEAVKGDPDALGISAEALCLASKSRIGCRLPITDQLFDRAIAAAYADGEPGLAIALRIERYFGHRGQEAIMSPSELQKYALETADVINGKLTVRDGTKGGLVRQTVAVSKYAREALQAISDALHYMKSHAFLVEGKKPGLKAARRKYHALCRKIGLVGQYSPHSIRYRYCCDKLEELRDAGVSRQDALALCSAYLGHGKSRGRFVKMVYGRTVMESFPKGTRLRRGMAQAAEAVDALIRQAYPT